MVSGEALQLLPGFVTLVVYSAVLNFLEQHLKGKDKTSIAIVVHLT